MPQTRILNIPSEKGLIEWKYGAIKNSLLDKVVLKLDKGKVMVMDNLAADQPRDIEELITANVPRVVYLFSYQPDLNLIELSWPHIVIRGLCNSEMRWMLTDTSESIRR